MIFDTVSLTAINMIQAHKSAIAALAINSQGTALATASDKGTIIRVFSLPDAKRVGEYRRGSKAARVFSMNFNTEGTLLCVSSDTETVHVYNLVEPIHGAPNRKRGEQDAEQTGIHPHSPPASEAPSSPTLSMSNNTAQPNRSQQQIQQPPTTTASASFSRRSLHLGKNLVAGMGGYMPKGVTEMWEPRRDFAYLKLRGGGGIRSVVAMSP
jgi:autophagy-related protein 18